MRIGVDLGGTKIEIAAYGTDAAPLVRLRVPTPSGDYDAIVDAVCALVHEVELRVGSQGTLGVGTPGAASPAGGTIKNANSTVLIGKPLQADLERALKRTVRIANDADCFALSESIAGAASGAAIVFGAILGTGVGGGIVIDGTLLAGRNAIAGEWGHNPLPWSDAGERPGPRCYCGKHGCIETFLSGPALARDHASGGGDFQTALGIATAARSGDAAAQASLERYAHRLARALASVINIVDPDTVVLGGGLSNIEMLYERVPRLLADFVFSDVISTRIVPARHGDSSGVRGAAWLWPPP